MFEPQSMTATVYVRFHYKNPEAKSPDKGATEMIGKILDQASEMDPAFQELLVKFADYLSHQSQKAG